MFPTLQRVLTAKAQDRIIAIKTLDQIGIVIANQQLIIGGLDDHAFPTLRVKNCAACAIGGPFTIRTLHPAFGTKIERIGAIAAIQRVIA